MKRRRRDSDGEIRREYREILKRPHVSDEQIERMRKHVQTLAEAFCDHVWKKKVY